MAGLQAKVNAASLKKFQANIAALNDAQRAAWTEEAVKELAKRLLRKAIKRTPVGVYPSGSGKTGGMLRRNWSVGKVIRSGDAFKVEIINPVEYAPYVEFGHRTRNHASWVEGRFMLTISENELENEAPRILIAKLNKLIAGLIA